METHLVVVAAQRYADSYELAIAGLERVRITLALYEHEDEIESRIRDLISTADGILFGGPAPFDICREWLPERLPVSVLRLRAVDLALTLARAAQQRLELAPASVDTFDPITITETFAEVGIDADLVAMGPFASGRTISELVNFHVEAHRRLATRYAVTARPAAHTELSESLPVPVLTVTPSVPGIRAAVSEAALSARADKEATSQFVAALVQLPRSGDLQNDDLNQVQLRRALHANSELGDSWIEPRGAGTLLLFAHRALMEKLTDNWTTLPLLEQIRSATGLQPFVGLGLGGTARDSVRQAEHALTRASGETAPCAFLYTSTGQIVGPIGAGSPPRRSSYKTTSEDLRALSTLTGLGVTTLTALRELERQTATKAITADEIAHHLRLTPQSARRIIRILREHKLISSAGIAQPARRGRPSTLYRLHLSGIR